MKCFDCPLSKNAVLFDWVFFLISLLKLEMRPKFQIVWFSIDWKICWDRRADQQVLLSFDLMSTFVLNDLHSSPCSLVSGWPQESDLPHGQQGAVLWTSWNASGVSDLTIWAWCPWKPLTCRSLTFTYNTELMIVVFYCFSHNRKKRLLFYFNILKCASPLVLLEFQCPTTQVGNLIFLSFMCIATFLISNNHVNWHDCMLLFVCSYV